MVRDAVAFRILVISVITVSQNISLWSYVWERCCGAISYRINLALFAGEIVRAHTASFSADAHTGREEVCLVLLCFTN